MSSVAYQFRALLLLFCVASLVSCGGAPQTDTKEPPAKPPHVVLILADDMGVGDIGAYSSASKVPTPRLDQLASEGARFTDAHSPSAVCTPTRYAILTGRYCWRVLKSGVLGGSSANMIDLDQYTMAEMFRDAGYATACFGKWHLGLGEGDGPDFNGVLKPGPLDHGFDRFFGIPASLDMAPYVYVEGDRVTAAATGQIAGSQQARNGGGGFWRAGAIAPDFRHDQVLPRTTEEAVEWIVGQDGEQPFFVYIPFSAPHTPWLPAEEFQGRSGAGVYGDFAAMVDHSVGQILDALDEAGHAENTLVVFTADNGAHWTLGDKEKYDHFANGEVRGQKADIHEGGHRVPFLVRWPGVVEADSLRPELIGQVDLMHSFACVAGQPLPPDAAEDSFDLSALFGPEPSAAATRPHLVHHSFDGMFAIRQGPWKLIEGLGSGGFTPPRRAEAEEGQPAVQLYQLEEDPMESINLAAQMPERVEELQALLDRVREQGRSRPQ